MKKQIIIVGIIVLLITVGLSGCQNNTTKKSESKDSDSDGYTDDMELSYGTNPQEKNSFPLDTDKDGIPDDNSPDGKYIGDSDDDNDGLSDIIEIQLGSNPKNESDVAKISINGTEYYLVDTKICSIRISNL